MKLQFISEQELEKINLIFALMNELPDSSKENYIPKIMKRYEFISEATNYSYKIYYYDVNIYLLRLNNKRKKLKKIRYKITNFNTDNSLYFIILQYLSKLKYSVGVFLF